MNMTKKSPVDDTFGIWKEEKGGVEYIKALRREWKTRLKKSFAKRQR